MTNRVVRQPERGEKKSPSPPDAPPMVGDRMAGSPSTGIRETDTGPDGVPGRRTTSSSRPKSRPWRSQSVRSSDEAGNDRGAKGRRKVDA